MNTSVELYCRMIERFKLEFFPSLLHQLVDRKVELSFKMMIGESPVYYTFITKVISCKLEVVKVPLDFYTLSLLTTSVPLNRFKDCSIDGIYFTCYPNENADHDFFGLELSDDEYIKQKNKPSVINEIKFRLI